VLSATDLPTEEERKSALALVPYSDSLHDLTGFVRGALMDRSVDLIDAALGEGHTRGALVALQEGVDVLFQATVDVVDSSLAASVLARIEVAAPLVEAKRRETTSAPDCRSAQRASRSRTRR
jgi:hypothetical protein